MWPAHSAQTLEVTERQIDEASALELIDLARRTGLLVKDEEGFPEFIRVRLKRALR